MMSKLLNSTAPAPASFIPVFLLCPGVSLSDATAAGVVRDLEGAVGSLHENVANCVQMRGVGTSWRREEGEHVTMMM